MLVCKQMTMSNIDMKRNRKKYIEKKPVFTVSHTKPCQRDRANGKQKKSEARGWTSVSLFLFCCSVFFYCVIDKIDNSIKINVEKNDLFKRKSASGGDGVTHGESERKHIDDKGNNKTNKIKFKKSLLFSFFPSSSFSSSNERDRKSMSDFTSTCPSLPPPKSRDGNYFQINQSFAVDAGWSMFVASRIGRVFLCSFKHQCESNGNERESREREKERKSVRITKKRRGITSVAEMWKMNVNDIRSAPSRKGEKENVIYLNCWDTKTVKKRVREREKERKWTNNI